MTKSIQKPRVNSARKDNDLILVEFKAPKDLLEKFDSKSSTQFSSRSEALRALIRKFLEEVT